MRQATFEIAVDQYRSNIDNGIRGANHEHRQEQKIFCPSNDHVSYPRRGHFGHFGKTRIHCPYGTNHTRHKSDDISTGGVPKTK